MELTIKQIGNSYGLQLSKSLINRYNFNDKIELILEKEYIILKPIVKTRKNWDIAFKKMNENNDDELLFNDAVMFLSPHTNQNPVHQ